MGALRSFFPASLAAAGHVGREEEDSVGVRAGPVHVGQVPGGLSQERGRL